MKKVIWEWQHYNNVITKCGKCDVRLRTFKKWNYKMIKL